MIETLFGLDRLGTPGAFFAALVVGLLFGVALERAGFGSSRRLAGIFYFTDMAVLKVMFTALVTAMLGLALVQELGVLAPHQLYVLPTVYGAQVVGGLIFGVGFVMGGWCPGTAAVGVGSGRIDALVFLGGAVVGSVFFNELHSVLQPLYEWGRQPEPLVAFGMSKPLFSLVVTVVALAAFWFAERVELKASGRQTYLGTPFLKGFGLVLLFVAASLFVFPEGDAAEPHATGSPKGGLSDLALLQAVEEAEDHMEPEDLADRLVRGQQDLVVVDVRSPAEFAAFHVRGAVNVPLPDLPQYLAPWRNRGTIVLYSNGMTHPAQARDALARMGFGNVYHLTDGLTGFVERCLRPVSLRTEPLTSSAAAKVASWRAFFVEGRTPPPPAGQQEEPTPPARFPGYIQTAWLAENLTRSDVRVIDVRDSKEYTGGHIPGSLSLNCESFRGVVNGVPASLLPAETLASHLSLMGIMPSDTLVLATGDKIRDATLVGMGLLRLRHARWALLHGGIARWKAEHRPMDTTLPAVEPSQYPVPERAEGFSVDHRELLQRVRDGRTAILDVRPAAYYLGEKSDEARAGHIPGAINRPFEEDLGAGGRLRAIAELEAAYRKLLPRKDAPVIVHCRTGHQASQTFFVLRFLLGYQDVRWYGAGWTEWAARPELPTE